MTFPALYALIVGMLMIGQWAFFLATGQVPELEIKTFPAGRLKKLIERAD